MKQPIVLYRAYTHRADDERASLRIGSRFGLVHSRARARRGARFVDRR